ncbi:MAG TPA: hypothetical protein VH593_14900 [Ktedonobacteraceae bacterium]
MVTKQIRALLPGLVLAVLLVILSGCGQQQVGAQGGGPDHLQIALYDPGSTAGKPTALVTLADASKVQQLYETVMALPLLPQNMACTADGGPSYTLTFLQGGKTLTTATAARFGCKPVMITGGGQDRQSSQDFWSQLDKAIYQATPLANPQQLAVLQTAQLGQQPQTAQITSVETVQRLYQAIVALPQAPQNENCTPDTLHEYQLVFHTANQAIPSVVDRTCNTVSLDGNNKSRSGTYVMNNQFKQLFAQTLAETSFAPAHPDQLTLQLQPSRGTDRQVTVADAKLRQQLYAKLLALPQAKTQPNWNCLGADKVAMKGMWYTLDFTQWDLPVLVTVDAYEGSCTQITLDANQGMGAGPLVQGDEEFWTLVHQAANT